LLFDFNNIQILRYDIEAFELSNSPLDEALIRLSKIKKYAFFNFDCFLIPKMIYNMLTSVRYAMGKEREGLACHSNFHLIYIVILSEGQIE